MSTGLLQYLFVSLTAGTHYDMHFGCKPHTPVLEVDPGAAVPGYSCNSLLADQGCHKGCLVVSTDWDWVLAYSQGSHVWASVGLACNPVGYLQTVGCTHPGALAGVVAAGCKETVLVV